MTTMPNSANYHLFTTNWRNTIRLACSRLKHLNIYCPVFGAVLPCDFVFHGMSINTPFLEVSNVLISVIHFLHLFSTYLCLFHEGLMSWMDVSLFPNASVAILGLLHFEISLELCPMRFCPTSKRHYFNNLSTSLIFLT